MQTQERAGAIFRRYLLASLAAVSVGLLCYVFFKLRAVLLMLAFAGFLAYFLEWPIRLLSRRLHRSVATRIVFYFFFLIVVACIPTIGAILYYQAVDFFRALPGYISQFPSQYDLLNGVVVGLQEKYIPGQEAHGLDEYIRTILEQLQSNAPEIINRAIGVTQNVLASAGSVMAGLIVVPVIALYILLDSARLRRSLVGCFPERVRSDMDKALDAINRSLGGYIYSRVILAAFIGVSMAIVMAILGVPYWLLLAFGLFLGEFIPVAGSLLAFIPIGIVVLVSSNPLNLVWILLANLVLQLIQNYIFAPRLTGETMNIHPLTVIIAMLIGGSIGGPAGLVVALPAAAALKILFNIFVFRRDEKGIAVPRLDLIAATGGAEFREMHRDGDAAVKPDLEDTKHLHQ